MEQMKNMMSGMDDETFVFGSLFITANLLETLLDRAFKPYGITVKQWQLLITIESLFSSPPTIQQIAGAMGTSHQNVKQIALNLERRGFLRLEKDASDARSTRLVTTEECRAFGEKTRLAGQAFVLKTFAGVSAEDLHGARNTLAALWQNGLRMK